MNEIFKFRHEWKHEISYLDMLSVRQSMMAIANADSHFRKYINWCCIDCFCK